jgi:hypothetical protein
MSAVYQNTTFLTFHGFIRDLYASMEMSSDGINKMWQLASNRADMSENRNVHENHLGEGIHREQLHPGSHLDKMTENYIVVIERDTQWIVNHDAISCAKEEKTLSLHHWCAKILGTAAVEGFFGEILLELEPELLKHFFRIRCR